MTKPTYRSLRDAASTTDFAAMERIAELEAQLAALTASGDAAGPTINQLSTPPVIDSSGSASVEGWIPVSERKPRLEQKVWVSDWTGAVSLRRFPGDFAKSDTHWTPAIPPNPPTEGAQS